MKPEKAYRVCCTRYYIAVQMVDVKARTPEGAASKATRAAQKVDPNPRAVATDNHWQADEPLEVPSVGHGSGRPYRMTEVYKGVFIFDSGSP